MIRNVIFDMGNVLILFDRSLFIHRLGVNGEDHALLMQEVFCGPEWIGMDWGAYTEASALESICRRLPQRLHAAAEALVFRWDEPLIPIEGMYELTEELKRSGYGVYLLSNASVRQHDYWPRISASRFFDGTLISADEKVIKPQPEIYLRCLQKFGLQAQECFFIDDMPENVAGAIRCGLSGSVFTKDVSALRRALREAGVKIEA